MQTINKIQPYLFYLLGLLTLLPFIDGSSALALGIISGYIFEKHYEQKKIDQVSQQLLKISIVLIGFSINAVDAVKASSQSFLIILFSILLTFSLSYWLFKKIRIGPKICFLIASGTAICGGSAIAAVSPVVKAKNKDISMAIISIFLLNAIALFIFPVIGRYSGMTDLQFGLWCAIAIHDTSSVAGASAEFSGSAFQIATIVKLARTLWIVPLVFLASYYFKYQKRKINIPLFIILFIVAILISTYLFNDAIKSALKSISKEILDAALFLIGSALKPNKMKNFFSKTFFFSLILWFIISVILFFIVKNYY